MGNSDLPVASGARHVAALERLGWTMARRARGKHYLMKRSGNPNHISIPDHPEVKRALLAKALKVAGVNHSTYIDAFNRKR